MLFAHRIEAHGDLHDRPLGLRYPDVQDAVSLGARSNLVMIGSPDAQVGDALEWVVVWHGQPDIYYVSAGRHILHGQSVGKRKLSLRGGEGAVYAQQQKCRDFSHCFILVS